MCLRGRRRSFRSCRRRCTRRWYRHIRVCRSVGSARRERCCPSLALRTQIINSFSTQRLEIKCTCTAVAGVTNCDDMNGLFDILVGVRGGDGAADVVGAGGTAERGHHSFYFLRRANPQQSKDQGETKSISCQAWRVFITVWLFIIFCALSLFSLYNFRQGFFRIHSNRTQE